MIQLNLPTYDYRLKQNSDGSISIWDATRHRYVALTPEEWVRQHFVSYLITQRNFPAGRIGNEISMKINGRPRRCDTVAYNAQGDALLLIEYKAPHVAISQEVFDQIVRYNMVFQVPYIVVSNGLTHYCCHIDYTTRQYTFLPDIPCYEQML